MKKKILSYIPLILILVAMLCVYLSGVYHDFNFNYIQLKHTEWKQYIAIHPYLAALYYIGIYIVSVCLVIPDSIFLSLLAGFLFPLPLAIFYVVLSETIGATLFFFAIRTAFITKKKGPKLIKAEKAVQKNQVYYLLFFRFSHLLPFWVINLAAAFLNIRKWTFIWTTFIGVFPLAIVLTEGGSGLSHYFEQHTNFTVADIFNMQTKLTLIFCGLLALLPLLIKQLKNRLKDCHAKTRGRQY